jgi:hypothetical protein
VQSLQAYPVYYSRLKNPNTNQRVHLIGDVHETTTLQATHRDSEAELLQCLKEIISDSNSTVKVVVEQDKNSKLINENDVKDVGFAELALFADTMGESKLYIRELFSELEGFQEELGDKKTNSSVEGVVRDRDLLYVFITLAMFPNTSYNLFEKDNLIQKKFLNVINSFEKRINEKRISNIVTEIKNLISDSEVTQNKNEKVLALVNKLGLYSLDNVVVKKIKEDSNSEFIFYLGAAHSVEIAKLLEDSGFNLEKEESNLPEPMIGYLRDDKYYSWFSSLLQLINYPTSFILSKDIWKELRAN